MLFDCAGPQYQPVISLNIYNGSEAGNINWGSSGSCLGVDRLKNSGGFIGRKGNYSIWSYANVPCDYMVRANTYFIDDILII